MRVLMHRVSVFLPCGSTWVFPILLHFFFIIKVTNSLQTGNLITDGKRDLWIDLGLFSYGTPEWDIAQLWVFTNRLDEDRQKLLFHLDRAQMLEHWDIFVKAYYGIDTPEQIGAAVQHLLPYAAIRIPFMLNMAYRTPISEGLAKFVISLLPKD